jgi:hypothetical protein
VRLLDPDVGPDILEDGGLGQAADEVEINPCLIERFEELLP